MADDSVVRLTDISDLLGWDDPLIYQWVIHNPRSDAYENNLHLALTLFIMLILPLINYRLFIFIESKSVFLSFFIEISIFLIYFVLIIFRVYKIVLKKNLKGFRKNGMRFNFVIIISPMIYIMASPSSFLHQYFNGSVGEYNQWLLFFLDSLIGVMTFNISDVLNIRFSSISPNGWQAGIVTLILQLAIGVGLIELMIDAYQTTFEKRIFYGTVQECFYECESIFNLNSKIRLKRQGKVVYNIAPLDFNLEEFVKLLKKIDK